MKNKNHIKIKRNRFSESLSFWVFFVIFSAIIYGDLNICLAMNYDAGDALKKNDVLQKTKENLLGSYFNSSKVATASESSQNSVGRTVSGENSKGMEDVDNGNGGIVANVFSFFRKAYCGAFWRIDDDCGVELFSSVSPNQEEILRTNQEVSEKNEIYTEGDGYNRIITGNGLSVVLNQDAPQEIHQEFLEINSALKLRGHSLSLSSRGLKVSNSYDDDFLTKDTNFKGDVGGNYKNIAIRDGVIGFSNWSSNSCANGQIPKYNGSAWVCGDDGNDVYSAGDGLQLVGGEFSAKLNGSSLLSGVAGLSINLGNANIWTETQTFSKAIVAPTTVDTINGLVVNAGALSNVASITGSGALSVASGAGNDLTLDSGTTGAVNLGTGANAKTITIGNTTAGTTLAINAGNATTGGINFDSNTLYVDTVNNNVGINTTSPSGRLDVEQSGAATAANYGIYTANTATSATDSVNKYGMYISSTGTWSGTSANNYGLYVDTPTGGTNNYAAIFAGGNVGIGTATPGQQLEITGNFKLANTTHADVSGIIYKNSDLFLHDFTYGLNAGGVTPAGGNLFLGISAGNLSTGSTATASAQSSHNTGIGYNALHYIAAGADNTAVGFGALLNTSGGVRNSAFGSFAMYQNGTGSYGAAFGYGALRNVTGGSNSAFGYMAGAAIADGSLTNITSTSSVYLGRDTKALANGDTNEIVIGYDATGLGSNTAVLGNDSITTTALKGNVGIGTTDLDGTPAIGRLTVKGSTNDGSTNIFVGRDSDEANVFSLDTNGKIILNNAVMIKNYAGHVQIRTPGDTNQANIDAGAFYGYGSSATQPIHSFSYDSDTGINNGGGSGNNDILNLIAGGVVGLNIVETGGIANVGIGNTSPTGKLDIAESGAKTAVDYGLYLANTATSATASINKYGMYISSTGTWNGASANNYGLYVDTPTGGTNNYAAIFAGGNVGIGTASPTDQLYIYADSGSKGFSIKNPNPYVTLSVAGTSNFSTFGYSSSNAIAQWSSNAGMLLSGGNITLTSNNGAGNVVMNGFVGIGTTAPDNNLEINSATGGTMRLTYNDNNGSATDYSTLGVSASGLTTLTTVDSDGASGHIALMPDGNVGIGTASPDNTLSVKGSGTGTIAIGQLSDSTSTGAIGFTPGGALSTSNYALAGSQTGTILNAPSSGAINFRIGNTTKMLMDTNGNVGIGMTSIRTIGGAIRKFNIEGDTTSVASISLIENYNNVYGSSIYLGKTRGSSIGSNTIVQNGDTLGSLAFVGSDGVDMDNTAARISSLVDGTPAADKIPANLIFYVKPDSAVALSEAARISSSGNFGIGSTSPTGKLDIAESGAKTAVDYGLYLANTATSATDSINKYGMYISSTGTWSGASANNYGLYVDTPTGGTNNYAAIFAGGNVGIGTTTPDQALDVIGTIQASNLLGGATNITTDANGNIIRDPSDQRLKENIQTITGALDKVMMLRGVSYEWKDKKKMGNQADFGLIAQEVQGVVPELATESAEGIMGVKYTNAVGLLINAIKEQQGEIQNMGIAFSTKDLVAENIKANHIEGLEFMQKDIVDGKEEAKNLAEAIKLMESQIALLEKDNEKLKDDSEAVSRVLGVGDKAVSFAVNVSVLKNLAVSGGLTVDDSAVFKKDVEFQGNVAYNTSAAGFAKIKKGDKKVEVDFDRPFANTPIIMVNAQDSGISFAVSDESRSGFVIKTKKEAEDDINFSWTAVHVKGAKTYKSDGGSSSSGSAVSATSLNESETTAESSLVNVSVSSATSSSSATNESSSGDSVSDLSTGNGDNL